MEGAASRPVLSGALQVDMLADDCNDVLVCAINLILRDQTAHDVSSARMLSGISILRIATMRLFGITSRSVHVWMRRRLTSSFSASASIPPKCSHSCWMMT
ncbi:MAG: hypothetical protein [Caudoviricetes sp.]|nr:MAG: hypothetical protein [Caudoviricetes sp.]